MTWFPEEITEAQTVCALRFLGYEYEKASGLEVPHSTGGGLSKLIEPIVRSRVLYTEQNANFAAFFGLQRFLHKWGGEYLTKYSDQHLAYDLLFLHLYRFETPPEFTNPDYTTRWQQEFMERAETIAAFVRKSFRRVGRGKKLAI